MRRRTLTLVTVVAAAALTATSCSDDSGDGEGTGGQASITYEFWDPVIVETTQELADEFMQEHPDISVKVVQSPPDQYWTRLQTAMSGDNPPDVLTMNGPNFELYASHDMLLPLNDFLEEGDVDTGAYPESLNELYTYDDEQMAVPVNFATIGLWYDKQLFDAAGVSYPDDTWTWDDLTAAANSITDAQNGVYGIAAGSDAGYMAQEGYYNTIYQAGGHVISEDGEESGLDEPESIEGLRFWKDLLEAEVSPPYKEMVETPPSNMFQSGNVAMFYGGVWRAAQWREAGLKNVDVAPMPAGPEGSISTIHGVGNAISAGTDHPEAAWEFLKFITSKESQLRFAEAGVLIPAYEGTQQSWIDSMPEYNLQVYLDARDNAVPFPVSANTTAWSDGMKEILNQAWAGEIPIEDAAADAAAQMDETLAEEDG